MASGTSFFRAHEISELYETDKKKHTQKEARLYELDAGIKLLNSQLEEADKEKNRLRTDNASLHAANMRLKSVSFYVGHSLH